MAEVVSVLGLIANILGILEAIDKSKTIIKNYIHSSASLRAELVPLLGKLTAFAGLLRGLQLECELDESDDGRLQVLRHIREPLEDSKWAVSVIVTRLEQVITVGGISLSFGKILNKETAASLHMLDQAKSVLELALTADPRTLLTSIEKYRRQIENSNLHETREEAMRRLYWPLQHMRKSGFRASRGPSDRPIGHPNSGAPAATLLAPYQEPMRYGDNVLNFRNAGPETSAEPRRPSPRRLPPDKIIHTSYKAERSTVPRHQNIHYESTLITASEALTTTVSDAYRYLPLPPMPSPATDKIQSSDVNPSAKEARSSGPSTYNLKGNVKDLSKQYDEHVPATCPPDSAYDLPYDLKSRGRRWLEQRAAKKPLSKDISEFPGRHELPGGHELPGRHELLGRYSTPPDSISSSRNSGLPDYIVKALNSYDAAAKTMHDLSSLQYGDDVDADREADAGLAAMQAAEDQEATTLVELEAIGRVELEAIDKRFSGTTLRSELE